MIDDFLKAISQVFDRRFLGVLLKSVGLTIALLAATVTGLIYLLAFLPDLTFSLPWMGEVTAFNGIAAGASVFVIMILSIFAMLPVASMFIGLFLDEIAEAVEARHYPHLPPARQQSMGEALSQVARFTLTVIVANMLALVLYLFLPFAFWIVNGYLLGREYFEVVAMRRMDEAAARALRKKHFFTVWTAGALVAVPLSIPFVNLLAPLVGVAAFVHLYHRKAARA